MSPAELERLLKLRRVPHGQLVLNWNAVSSDPEVVKLKERLRYLVEQHLTDSQSVAIPGGMMVQRRGTSDQVVLQNGSLVVMRNFTKNVEKETDLLSAWISKNWSSFIRAFDGPIKLRFLAIILTVELSCEGVADEASEKALVARYFRPLAGWEDLADAEFRIAKAYDDRYYLNFGLSTYRTINLSMRAQPNILQEPQATPTMRVDVDQSVVDHGLKVQVDANTKVNQMKGAPPIEVTMKDFNRCLELAIGGIDSELEPFLRMA